MFMRTTTVPPHDVHEDNYCTTTGCSLGQLVHHHRMFMRITTAPPQNVHDENYSTTTTECS
jgi:hypothetical protein